MDGIYEFEVKVSKKYLNIPVMAGAGEIPVLSYCDGKIGRYFDLEPGTLEENDFIANCNVEEFLGRTLIFRVRWQNRSFEKLIFQTDKPAGLISLYREKFRPRFHFSCRRGWLNDPNGLVWNDGIWHMFYQHNPFALKWRPPMHWGHAVSSDLTHWKELDDVFYPDELGIIYSGSAIVDNANVSGLGDGKTPAMLAFYTSAGHYAPTPVAYSQSMAFSLDGGSKWEKYHGNPVLAAISGESRDPKLVFHSESRRWIMALFLEDKTEGIGRYGLYASENLRDWRLLQEFEMHGRECPDLFELSLDGDSSRRKWVFMNACADYLVGSFDGSRFVPEQQVFCAYDKSSSIAYAPQTYSNAPDGRVIQVAWFRQKLPGMPFNQFMSLPMELSLRGIGGEMRLFKKPVSELATLHGMWLDADNLMRGFFHGHIKFAFESGGDWSFQLRGIVFVWDSEKGVFRSGKDEFVLLARGQRIEVEVFVDIASLEIFVNGGELYLPLGFDPDGIPVGFKILSGNCQFFEAYEMKSIWADACYGE
ncbi:MAG: hypothetical protein A2X49_04055 [Lentisphaerae bacterium GWF2_52_8]|nr:MAG: hypothetical protein A2X49_04055 [Lentisphaerae bacterium GWF2_52_8]